MRTACLGLVLRRREDVQVLVAMVVETSRLTKKHPTGYLGGVCAAFFTALALQGMPVQLWGRCFVDEIIPAVRAYVLRDGQRHLRENEAAFAEGAFEANWRWYLQERGLGGGGEVRFPSAYGPAERDSFYAQCAHMPEVNSSGKNPGSKGYDSVLIAYDALLCVETQLVQEPASTRWAELCYRAVLHRGDNDSTGSIASAWYGALHGFAGVPAQHLRVEYRGRCDAGGIALERIAQVLARTCNGVPLPLIE